MVSDPIDDDGLTEEQIEGLIVERRELVADLVTTPDGRRLVRSTDSQIDDTGSLVAQDIKALGRAARQSGEGGELLRSRAAAIVLSELTLLAHREATHDLYAHRSRLYTRAQKGHAWLDRLIRSKRRNRKGDRKQSMLAKNWGFLGTLFTLAASPVLFLGNFQAAAALIGARIVVTTLVWSASSYPSDDSPDEPVLDADPRICVLGHAADMFLFASIAAGLIRADHIFSAFLVISTACIMILGTLMRIAASASGFQIPRLHLERMVRGGSTFAAVYLASMETISWWWAPTALIILPTVFAAIETQEALRALKPQPTHPIPPFTPTTNQRVHASVR